MPFTASLTERAEQVLAAIAIVLKNVEARMLETYRIQEKVGMMVI